jgi:hypothetical protein
MQIYNYDHDTGEYQGFAIADENPLEPGEFLIPAFATTTAPPAPGTKQAAAFVAGTWALVPDHRGETWYIARGVPYVVIQIGDPTTMTSEGDPDQGKPAFNGLFATEPAPTQAELIAYANAAQWMKAVGGRALTVAGQSITFSTSDTSLSLMNGVVSRLQRPSPPASVQWQTGATTFVTIAASDFITAATSIADFVQATFDALPAIFADIASGAVTTTAQIDQRFAAL